MLGFLVSYFWMCLSEHVTTIYLNTYTHKHTHTSIAINVYNLQVSAFINIEMHALFFSCSFFLNTELQSQKHLEVMVLKW